MKQPDSSFYFDLAYDNMERFVSYWYQIREIIRLSPEKVLEVGMGNGFLSEYLRKRNVNVVTLDIERELAPDVVGSVADIPFKNGSFNVVACYEVLEHLPFENFRKALSEIFRVSAMFAVLSLPDAGNVYRFCVHIPGRGVVKKLIPLPVFDKSIREPHYWEIGKPGYPINRIIRDIEAAGFRVETQYRIFENPYHRFFVLRKGSRNNGCS